MTTDHTPAHLRRAPIYQPPEYPAGFGLDWGPEIPVEPPPARLSPWQPFLLWLAASAVCGLLLGLMVPI